MGTSRPYALRPLLNPEHMRIGLANASARRKRWSKSHARITPGSIHQRMGVCRQRRYQASTRANCATHPKAGAIIRSKVPLLLWSSKPHGAGNATCSVTEGRLDTETSCPEV